MEYEADAKHAEMVCEEMGLEKTSKGLEKPCVQEEAVEVVGKEEPLCRAEATSFRATAAIDVQYAVKEICRDMAIPTASSWIRLKRLARYLLEFPRLVWNFSDRRTDASVIRVFSDSDWAGCRRTRKSTSGGVLTFRGVAVKHWSSTQASISLPRGRLNI